MLIFVLAYDGIHLLESIVGKTKQTEATNEVTITNQVVGVSDKDQLVLPVAPSGKLCYYTYWSGSGWCTQKSSAWVAEPPTLQAGLGCWILTKEDASINWVTNE